MIEIVSGCTYTKENTNANTKNSFEEVFDKMESIGLFRVERIARYNAPKVAATWRSKLSRGRERCNEPSTPIKQPTGKRMIRLPLAHIIHKRWTYVYAQSRRSNHPTTRTTRQSPKKKETAKEIPVEITALSGGVKKKLSWVSSARCTTACSPGRQEVNSGDIQDQLNAIEQGFYDELRNSVLNVGNVCWQNHRDGRGRRMCAVELLKYTRMILLTSKSLPVGESMLFECEYCLPQSATIAVFTAKAVLIEIRLSEMQSDGPVDSFHNSCASREPPVNQLNHQPGRAKVLEDVSVKEFGARHG
ncbi:hypothetical protein R3P38DRAFT_2797320 [Favolaschia claudopus]|uniref:Uncharacterized protein n=1 Tax=Favolaschia claudopus TaxID=2862362 RepID=A0AAW0A3W3_9AGAR